jgi:acetyltransferase-like isoleucine patch superfamily enzyme
MPIILTEKLIEALRSNGVTTLHCPGVNLPEESNFEPPCSIKWMSIESSLNIGAFSYAVSGYYWGCNIGRYASIGENVQIGRHSHPLHYISTSPFFYLPFSGVLDNSNPIYAESYALKDFQSNTPATVPKPTYIGNDVYIGHGAFILPGVTIGDGAVVAAMSIVTKDVPPYSVVAGTPATVRKFRFSSDLIAKLLTLKWWDFAPWQLKGITLDDPLEAIDFIEKLRSKNENTYAPRLVNLREMNTTL